MKIPSYDALQNLQLPGSTGQELKRFPQGEGVAISVEAGGSGNFASIQVPAVSISVPFLGLTSFQWRL